MRAEKADIVLMPYNYIVDIQIRKRIGLDLKNTVLIIDEAHNISAVIEESFSFNLDTRTLIILLG